MGHATTSRPRLTFAVLCVGTTSYSLMQAFVLPVLPLVERHFHTSTGTVSWVMTAYLLSASISTPILGRLGDLVGKERVLVVCLAMLGLGTIVCGLAPNIGVFLAGRLIQGLGGAVFPLAFGIIRDEFPAERIAGAIGTVSSLLAAGAGLGVVLAGPLTTHLGFSWLFWLPLVPITSAVIATHLFIPESPVRATGRISLLPGLVLSAWLIALLLGVSEGPAWGWTSGRVLVLLAAFVVTFIAWIAVELRADEPLIDMRMMRVPAVFRANIVALLFGAVLYSFAILTPSFLQAPVSAGYGFHLSVTMSGLYQSPNCIATFVLGFLVGRLTLRFGSKGVTVIGGLLATAAYAFIAPFHGQLALVCFFSTLFGMGSSLAFAALSTLVVEAVDADQTGVASGMNANIRTIGGAIGTTIATVILTAGTHADQLPHESGYVRAYAALAVAGLLSIIAALTVPTRKADEPFVRAATYQPEPAMADA